ncbi:enhanced intracellular survival protein Eis [Natrialbaceae archaeon A-chndr2]
MSKYCALPDTQRAVFHEYVSYAFSPQEGPPEYDPEEDETQREQLGSRRGLYPDDVATRPAENGLERLETDDPPDPLCVCRHYWFETNIRGEGLLTPGLSAVASPPENRRGGHVRELLRHSLEEYREREAPFSLLWPFRYRFYRQYGWDTTNRYLRVECEPEDLAFARARREPDGSEHEFRALEADDYPALESVYERYADRYDCRIDRDGDWWRYRIFENWTTDPFVYVWERDGKPAAYLRYVIDGDWGDRTMTVSELVAVDLEAFRAALAFCHDHDSQVSAVKLRLPVDTPLFDIATDPDELEVEYHTGPMARIVDVERALRVLSYPGGTEETITLAVTDPLVDWNDGTFELAVADGNGSCHRLGTAVTSDGTRVDERGDVDAILDIATLSQLAIGARSGGALERARRLECDSAGLESLERLFPERNIFLEEGF